MVDDLCVWGCVLVNDSFGVTLEPVDDPGGKGGKATPFKGMRFLNLESVRSLPSCSHPIFGCSVPSTSGKYVNKLLNQVTLLLL